MTVGRRCRLRLATLVAGMALPVFGLGVAAAVERTPPVVDRPATVSWHDAPADAPISTPIQARTIAPLAEAPDPAAGRPTGLPAPATTTGRGDRLTSGRTVPPGAVPAPTARAPGEEEGPAAGSAAAPPASGAEPPPGTGDVPPPAAEAALPRSLTPRPGMLPSAELMPVPTGVATAPVPIPDAGKSSARSLPPAPVTTAPAPDPTRAPVTRTEPPLATPAPVSIPLPVQRASSDELTQLPVRTPEVLGPDDPSANPAAREVPTRQAGADATAAPGPSVQRPPTQRSSSQLVMGDAATVRPQAPNPPPAAVTGEATPRVAVAGSGVPRAVDPPASGRLPMTGTELAAMILYGGLLFSGGSALIAVSRRQV